MPKQSSNIADNGLSRETQLILGCARSCPDTAQTNRVSGLSQQDIDWHGLYEQSVKHGVAPLVHRNLKVICPEMIPADVQAQFGTLIRANAGMSLFLTGELIRLVRLFTDNGIQAIPFKGPVLAVAAYSNPSLRQFSDIDFIIHQKDFFTVKDLLKAQGYQLYNLMADTGEGFDFNTNNAVEFYQTKHQIVLDLHWRFTRKYIPFSFDFNKMWDRAEPISMSGTMVPNISAEDLLLILCVHGSKHGPIPWEKLKWICDIAELINANQTLNWKQILGQAKRSGNLRILLLGLLLAHNLLDMPLPPELEPSLQANPVVKTLAKQVEAALFSGIDEPFQGAKKYTFRLQMRERFRDRVPYFLYMIQDRHKMTPNEKDRESLPLPKYLSFLHYPLRPIRLIKEYGLNRLKYLLGFSR